MATNYTTRVLVVGVESVEETSAGALVLKDGQPIDDGGTTSCALESALNATPSIPKIDMLRPWNSPLLSVALVALTKNLQVTGNYDSGSWLSMHQNPSALSFYVCANP